MTTPHGFPQLQYTQEHTAVGLAHPALGLHARERIEAARMRFVSDSPGRSMWR